MKKMTRLMAMLLSLLVLFQSAALADGTTAVSSDAVTEELYQGWVETATTYAADKTVAAGGSTSFYLQYAEYYGYNYRVRLNGSTVSNGFTISDSGSTVTVDVDDSVAAGTYTIQYRRGSSGSWSNLGTVEVTASGSSGGASGNTATKEEVLETFSNNNSQTSRVFLAVRRNGEIPGEPSDQGKASYNFYNSNYSTNGMVFASSPDGIINENIVDYQNFIFTSVDGTKTAGLVDSTGTTTNQVLSGIDFNKLLDAIAESEDVQASDKQVVTEENKENYRVVCYVIKLQFNTPMSDGWHIDCAVVPKTYVTLSYDINIPDGYVYKTSGVGVPYSETGLPPATFTVGEMEGLTTVENETNAILVVSADGEESYAFMFQGWNTKADGSGDWYQPNSPITIEENTVLYAIWNSNPAMGTGNLEIQKIVSAEPELSDADKTKLFTFKVEISNAEPADKEFDYVIYNADTVQVGIGKIKSGGTVTLKHSQYVEIKNIPAVNDDNGAANVKITEQSCEGYTPSWENGETTATIQGGRDSRVTCTNVAAPRTTTVTITKQVEGNMGDRSKEFTFNVKLYDSTGALVVPSIGTGYTVSADGTVSLNLAHEGSVTIIGVLVGCKVVVEESEAGYDEKYQISHAGVTSEEVEGRIATIETLDADGATFTFTNTKNENVDTGILLDSLPYVLILVLVGGGVVLWLANRRRRRED